MKNFTKKISLVALSALILIQAEACRIETVRMNPDSVISQKKESGIINKTIYSKLIYKYSKNSGKKKADPGKFHDELISAAENGVTQKLESLLKKGAIVNSTDERGMTPLIAAAGANRTETARFLISKGAQVNAETFDDGVSALVSAARSDMDSFETIKLLLENGADVNAADENGMTALMIIAEKMENRTLKLLIEKGADLNMTNRDMGTPLFIAKEAAGAEESALRQGIEGSELSVRQRKETAEILKKAGAKELIFEADPKLPYEYRRALHRINQYRDALGLPLLIYDSDLSEMAQSHADYVLKNCMEGRNYIGHYEMQDFPGYSSKGDEAARTSGLSYSERSPVVGLESLTAGSYHRGQFLDRNIRRIGIGFSFGSSSLEGGNCGATLFVTRGTEDGKNTESAERFTLFPPPDFIDTLTDFRGEWPDPRPDAEKWNSIGGSPVITGYIATVKLNGIDAENFKKTEGTLTDEKTGQNVPVWITDPANPSYGGAPSGMDNTYGPGHKINNNVFSKNVNTVFIMPKKQLSPGTVYRVKVSLTIGKEIQKLEWRFRTRH